MIFGVNEQWNSEVRDLFDELIGLDPLDREKRLGQLTSDSATAREVAALLAASERAGDFLGLLAESASSDGFAFERGRMVARRYTIERKIGSGAMSDVYLARDGQLDRPVALKFLRGTVHVELATLVQFVSEARLTARLEHPHIATVYDVSRTEDGRVFIVMAYYPGATLRDLVQRGPLATDDALRIAAQIADALAATHDAGIVHRDVKPGNVLFDAAGNVRLADFGVATLAGAEGLDTGVAVGTAGYMSPEQARGEAVDGRADLWALGVVLYEMLTGRRPFARSDHDALPHDDEPLGLPADLVPESRVRAVVATLLRRDVAERPSSAAEVSRVLRELTGGCRGAHAAHPGTSSLGMVPVAATRLIGRERERRIAATLLSENRVLTLTGPGGTGKTRLALQLAADVRHRYADGVWYVPLADTSDALLVPSVVARALGVCDADGVSSSDRVIAELRGRRALLVLDNFEHLLGAARFVATLVARCSNVTVLATSRAPLAVRGEQELPVPPLAMPAPNEPDASASEAVQLFVQRARAVRPGFSLDADALYAVAEICRRLDGLPLAIELAAAWARLLSARAILARLPHRFSLLHAQVADRPARHRSLRAVIDWSYALLSNEERALFDRLAVFTGGVSVEAAAAVAPWTEAERRSTPGVLGVLASLCRQNLLRREDGPDGEPRFFMLDTVREFALERLRGSAHEADARHRHQAYCLTLAARAVPAHVVAGAAR
jgi:predicted ATPase